MTTRGKQRGSPGEFIDSRRAAVNKMIAFCLNRERQETKILTARRCSVLIFWRVADSLYIYNLIIGCVQNVRKDAGLKEIGKHFD